MLCHFWVKSAPRALPLHHRGGPVRLRPAGLEVGPGAVQGGAVPQLAARVHRDVPPVAGGGVRPEGRDTGVLQVRLGGGVAPPSLLGCRIPFPTGNWNLIPDGGLGDDVSANGIDW